MYPQIIAFARSVDRIIFPCLYSYTPLIRGRQPVTLLAERGAASRGQGVIPALGRPRTPPGRHYGRSARSSLHWPGQAPVQEARPGVEAGPSSRLCPAVKSRGGAPEGAPAPPGRWSRDFLSLR